jgi:hypothetical protein
VQTPDANNTELMPIVADNPLMNRTIESSVSLCFQLLVIKTFKIFLNSPWQIGCLPFCAFTFILTVVFDEKAISQGRICPKFPKSSFTA